MTLWLHIGRENGLQKPWNVSIWPLPNTVASRGMAGKAEDRPWHTRNEAEATQELNARGEALIG